MTLNDLGLNRNDFTFRTRKYSQGDKKFTEISVNVSLFDWEFIQTTTLNEKHLFDIYYNDGIDIENELEQMLKDDIINFIINDKRFLRKIKLKRLENKATIINNYEIIKSKS